MAIATSCCLNLNPPPSLPSRTTQAAWHRDDKWRKQCVVGMACMIIGLQMESINIAFAKDMRVMMPVVVADSKVPRWSDIRKCPPWHMNSLETIVPENLPRPAARRRWESVRLSKNAPPVLKLNTVRNSSNCFSM